MNLNFNKKLLLLLGLLSLSQFNTCHLPIEPPQFQSNNYHTYLWGCFNHLEENPSLTQKCFESVLSKTESTYAYPGYIRHLYETNQFEKIVSLRGKVEKKLYDDLETQLIFVKALELTGNQIQADQKVINLYQQFKTNAEVIYGVSLAYIRKNNSSQALKVIDEYLATVDERPTNFIFYFLKAQLYLSAENKQLAQNNIKKCLELNPSFDQGWLLSGLMHELQGNLQEAITGYQNFLQIVGHDKAVEQQLVNLLFKRDQTIPFAHIKKTFEEALNLYRQKQYVPALRACENCLKQDPSYRPARLLKIELLCAVDQSKKALALLYSWIIKEPTEDIWFRSLHLLYQSNVDRENIIKTLQMLEQRLPNNILTALYLADIYLKRNVSVTASAYLKKALALNKDSQMRMKILYQLAVVYFENHQLDALSQVIESGLKTEQTFAPFYNLAAYYFATKGKNLSRAQELIITALQADKNNPHYLDTQAIIWYKNKQYEKAYTLLSKLSAQLPSDFFIQKHLSKTCYKQGLKNDALVLMKKALTHNGPTYEKQKCQKLVQLWSSQ
jgi:predicted Zn-dependent protease